MKTTLYVSGDIVVKKLMNSSKKLKKVCIDSERIEWIGNAFPTFYQAMFSGEVISTSCFEHEIEDLVARKIV